MTGRRRLGLVAASATLLAAAPLSTIFADWTWLLQCVLAVGLTAGAAVLARTLRFPLWAQAASMVGVLLLVLTWMFPSGGELLALLPTPSTFEHFGALFAEAGADTRAYGVPVPDRNGLLFLTVVGVGGCAIVVDLLTVGLRKPALAGLPMLAIYSVPVAVYVSSVPVLPFVIGAVGYLWLLVADNVDRVRRFGRRFTGDGRDVDVWEPSPLAAAGRRLALIGVAAAVLLPLAVPGMTTGLLSRLTQSGAGAGGNGSGAGGGSRLDLFASFSGQLTQRETTNMVKVTTEEQNPFYLRVGVLDVVNGQGFRSRAPRGERLSEGLPDPRTDDRTRGGTFQEYRAEVEILNLNMALAPLYSTVVKVDGLDNRWSYDPDLQVAFADRVSVQRRTYSFDYVRAQYTAAELRTASRAPEDVRTAYTTVPPDATVDRIVAGLVEGKRTDYDKVRAIYDYFSAKNNFTYSTETTGGTSGSEIASFLTSKKGYCQQYAAAMTWMVRAADIPARVALGYTAGSARDGNTRTITNRNAHAWTEVYLEGFGWIPFDATPAASVAGSTRTAWAPNTDAPDPATSTDADPSTPDPASSTAAGAAARPDRDLGDRGAAGGSPTTDSGPSTTTLVIIGSALLLLALLLLPALGRVLLRRRRHAATTAPPAAVATTTAGPDARDIVVTTEATRARKDAHAAWDELLDTMIDFRIPVDPTETPRHTAQRLVQVADLAETPATSATLLGTVEERARYARKPLQGGELTRALGEVRTGLARTASRRTRLTATLLPPSVLLRWRLAVADSSVRWMGTISHLRDGVVRFSPRRLLTGRAR